jgi:hypothetical protein
MIKQLALWYLKRCGLYVLPRVFVGMVIGGNAVAVEQEDGVFNVTLPSRRPVIALTGSQVMFKPDTVA